MIFFFNFYARIPPTPALVPLTLHSLKGWASCGTVAKATYIVMDCHVLLAPGAVKSLLDHWAEDPESKDILSGPLLYDDLKNISTHFDPTWRGDMYGTWETNRQAYNEGKAFEIPMMGLGAFACRREAWPGFNEHFVGFGAEEGYIHEKFRINGGRALCIPKFGWNHRFGRPNGVPYRLVLEDRIWNYIVGWMELYKNPEHEMIRGAVEHFKGKVNPQTMEDMVRKARDIYGC